MHNAQYNTMDVKGVCERKANMEFRDGGEFNGWAVINQQTLRVTVPHGRKPIPPKTYTSMAFQLLLFVHEFDEFIKCTLKKDEYSKRVSQRRSNGKTILCVKCNTPISSDTLVCPKCNFQTPVESITFINKTKEQCNQLLGESLRSFPKGNDIVSCIYKTGEFSIEASFENGKCIYGKISGVESFNVEKLLKANACDLSWNKKNESQWERTDVKFMANYSETNRALTIFRL